ncbi:MAG TPA: four helix bundle protein [Bacteroidota bacterium]|nr:four helix bundle protein [Bacteroidota bacterium]
MGGYSFEDLEVYQQARVFRKKMYKLARRLPPEEKYNLVGQMRRAALSLTNNIAEGHGRFHYQENIQFLRHSRGSLTELLDDLNTCIDEEYADVEELNGLKREGFELMRRINGYIAYLKRRKQEETN